MGWLAEPLSLHICWSFCFPVPSASELLHRNLGLCYPALLCTCVWAPSRPCSWRRERSPGGRPQRLGLTAAPRKFSFSAWRASGPSPGPGQGRTGKERTGVPGASEPPPSSGQRGGRSRTCLGRSTHFWVSRHVHLGRARLEDGCTLGAGSAGPGLWRLPVALAALLGRPRTPVWSWRCSPSPVQLAPSWPCARGPGGSTSVPPPCGAAVRFLSLSKHLKSVFWFPGGLSLRI